jgi:hypothetical protein
MCFDAGMLNIYPGLSQPVRIRTVVAIKKKTIIVDLASLFLMLHLILDMFISLFAVYASIRLLLLFLSK